MKPLIGLSGDETRGKTPLALHGTKIVAVEAIECPTMLCNGYGEHNIQGIGDKQDADGNRLKGSLSLGARILILDNHDDFGGHAKRNEFHQGGPMRPDQLQQPWMEGWPDGSASIGRGGRSADASDSQAASSSPRSASRIRIG